MSRVLDKRTKTPRHVAGWSVSVQQRPERDETHDGEEFLTGAVQEVVVVHDADGNRYELTIDRQGTTEKQRLIGLAMVRATGIGREELAAVPLATLQAVAEQALLQADQERGDGASTSDALAAGAMPVGEVRDGTPTPEEFAAMWNSTPARLIDASGTSIPRRELLAEHYGVTRWSIDKWSRAARDLGLIEKQRPGRPRKTDTDNPTKRKEK